MKTLHELCVPRKSVFDVSRRDTVLDLTDLLEDKVKAEDFFSENFFTAGLRTLLEKAFERLEGKSEQGIFLLTQAMGGGKTHSLFALGLLAKHAQLRKKFLKDIYPGVFDESVQLVAFSGREVDAPFGIWGSIAEQLGKKEEFKDYYSPLAAPGQSAWIKLLQGKPTLILLDELPPYLENARARTVGDSNLSNVTATALANLFVAISKDQLRNVCLVLTDLRAAWEGGTAKINEALQSLGKEATRVALPLEPVQMNTNEMYDILRTRLFERTPAEEETKQVAEGYRKALKDAVEMDLSTAQPEGLAAGIVDSYPFHPGIRDLYARFRENPGFQQTRALIRLMRLVVSNLFSEGGAKEKYLIGAHDLDLNDPSICSELKTINPHLSNAIAHDIANEGKSVAEELDKQTNTLSVQDASKCWLMSSLPNIPNGILGLTDAELVWYLVEPNRDLGRLKEAISIVSSKAWYLHTNRERRRYFKNTENLNAKLKGQADSYTKESRIKFIRSYLEDSFRPQLKDCYQEIMVLPSVDEILLKQDKVLLVITEPHQNELLTPELRKFWEDQQYKNRVLFLTGQSDTMSSVYNSAAELRSITSIIEVLKSEKVPGSDPQMIEATELRDKLELQFRSAIRETFTTIIYPQKNELRSADFTMEFGGNAYNGERQIRQKLLDTQKFTEDVVSETFKKKCEQRLFTQKEMPWADVLRRAATNSEWPWHKPDALDVLKRESLSKDYWRENGSLLDRGPFPPPTTDVRFRVKTRDEETGEVILEVKPVRGDQVFYKEVGSKASPKRVDNFENFHTKALQLEFSCEDSRGQHPTGEARTWQNQITVKSRFFSDRKKRMCEIQCAPPAEIKFVTDGSDPKQNGTVYSEPFALPEEASVLVAIAVAQGVQSEPYIKHIDWDKAPDHVEVSADRAYKWKREFRGEGTSPAFQLLDLIEKHGGTLIDPTIDLVNGSRWVQLVLGDDLSASPSAVKNVLSLLREKILSADVNLKIRTIYFASGQSMQDFARDMKLDIIPDEIEQTVPIREAA